MAALADAVSVDVPTEVSRDQIVKACEALGLDPFRLKYLHIGLTEVWVGVRIGEPFVVDAQRNELVTRLVTIPVKD